VDYLAQLKARLDQRRLGKQPSKPSKDAFEGFEGGGETAVLTPLPHLASVSVDEDQVAFFEERAALVAHDGGVPRSWADAFVRLHADRPPPHVSYRQWRQFVDDCGLFIDRWAVRAGELRWTPEDLFGWETCRPFQLAAMHIGLGWRIDGGTVVALTENAATVIGINKQRLTLGRRA
jgi:hypothetical protein